MLRALPAKAAIIDAELVACSTWVHLNGKDLLDLPLAKRRAKLQALIERHDHPTILFSAAINLRRHQ